MMYIIGLRIGLFLSGINIRSHLAEKSDNLIFAGGFIAALGWVNEDNHY